jgi:hypothetical protein
MLSGQQEIFMGLEEAGTRQAGRLGDAEAKAFGL